MKNSSSFFLLYVTVWSFTWITEVKSYENALVFDPINEKLEEVNEFQPCTSICLLACPSYTEDERSIDWYASVSGKGVYMDSIKTVVNAKTASEIHEEIDIKVCHEQYKPVMVQDTETKSYETGFELYYEDKRISLRCGKYEQFKKVTSKQSYQKEPQDSDGNLVLRTERNGNTIFQVPTQSRTEWAYFWISVLSIRVSEQNRQINFTKDHINQHHQLDRTMFRCDNYSLEDHSQLIHLKKWISFERKLSTLQKKWISFERKLSTQPEDGDKKVSEKEELKETSDNEEPDEYQDEGYIDYPINEKNNSVPVKYFLEGIQIMPMPYFHTLSARMATCTYLNLAYATQSITERLEEVDLYLYSIYRTWPSEINIIFGVSGLSKEISPKLLEKINNPDDEQLRKFPIPVPAVFYRIVEYNVEGEMRNAIILIHNILGSVRTEERICPTEFELQGWQGLGQGKVYQGFIHPTGLTYTCPITWEIIQKLGVDYENISIGNFNLNEHQQEEILKQKEIVTSKATDG